MMRGTTALIGVVIGFGSTFLAWWALRPAPPLPPVATPSVRPVIARSDPSSSPVRTVLRTTSSPAPERAAPERDARGPSPAPTGSVVPPRPVPPEEGDDAEAVARYRARVRLHRRLLRRLVDELLDTVATEPDPMLRLDAELTLVEVYLELADTLDATWIPEHWSERRAQRLIGRLEEAASVARDKARVVASLADAEMARLPAHAAPYRSRLQSLTQRLGDG